ncbi:MAG TPA: DUF1569 domain-containing protein [Flavobacterium sp.]|jgi:hypothetical protein
MNSKENIFDLQGNVSLVRRLEKLRPESRPLWGKMSVSQMLKHCQKPIEVAEGKLIIKGGIMGFLFGKMAKADFLRRDFRKNSPTVPGFKITDNPDYDTEWNVLVELVTKFREKGPSVIANKKHPFFGEMTEEEWGVLNYKHLDHHLRQFGV